MLLAYDGCSPSHFRFPKFHNMLHYLDYIRQFGSVVPNAGYAWESAIKVFLHMPYQVYYQAGVVSLMTTAIL